MELATIPKNTASHKKLNYINVFRALAIGFIVAGHSICRTGSAADSILEVLVGDGTVFFVFISGFLFQYLSDTFSYPEYLKKKFFNIVCPYLVTSVFGIAVLLAVARVNPLYPLPALEQIPLFLSTGVFHNFPTWYISMSCVFFLCAPLLLRFIRENRSAVLLMGIFLIPVAVPRFIIEFMNYSPYVCYARALAHNLFWTFLFFPIYILGMYVAAHKNYIPACYERRKILWLGTGVFLVVACWWNCAQPFPVTSRLLAFKIILTLLLVGYLAHYDAFLSRPTRLNNALDTVARYSFSIFFFHWYIDNGLALLFKALCGESFINFEIPDFWTWALISFFRFLIDFLGSLALAVVIKKTFLKFGLKNTRWMIGV